MSRDTQQFLLRLPRATRDWIKQSAAQNRRSMNGEIIFRLEAAIAAEAKSHPASAGGVQTVGTGS